MAGQLTCLEIFFTILENVTPEGSTPDNKPIINYDETT